MIKYRMQLLRYTIIFNIFILIGIKIFGIKYGNIDLIRFMINILIVVNIFSLFWETLNLKKKEEKI